MKPKFLARIEKTLVLLLMLSFLGPLAIGAWLHFSHNYSIGFAWLRNYTLAGSVFEPERVELNVDSVKSGKYQAAYAKNFDSNFPARELLIRLIDELYLRAFHSSPAGVIIGPDFTLYDKEYATEYGIIRQDRDKLRPLVDDLRRMQDFCTARGIAFAVLITPSKASVYPENMPATWRRRYNPGLRGYETLLPLLKESGIHYADGHQVLMDLKPKVKLPLYPLGGIHWGSEAAAATGNALLEVLATQGLPVTPDHDVKTSYTYEPSDHRDRDLADFLNPVVPLRYEVAEATPQPIDTGNRYRPNIVFVGGSFVWKMLAMLDASQQFSELEYYYYYTLSKNCQVDGEAHKIAEPAPPMNFDTDIFAADALVLEMNEQALYLPNHISRFLHDVLPKLPDPRSARAPYHYEGQQSYQWGDTLSLVAGKNSVKILKSFTIPGPEGTYTDGNLASLHFTVPPAPEDVWLDVSASAFLWGKVAPRQRVRMSVNGHPVGETIWDTGGISRHSLLVPKEYLNSEKLSLEFHLPDAASPSELGLFPEYRKLGISISKIRFRPTSAFEPNVRPLQYQWGDTLSFQVGKHPLTTPTIAGFTTPSEQGTYTDGPLASVHFAVPPATEDMKLQINAGAMLVGDRLPEQRVKVSVNSHYLGEWVWTESATSRHEVTVPKEYLSEGRVLLDFRLPNAVSPSDLGLYAEGRKLGINVASIVMYPASQFAHDAHPLQYQWGKLLTFAPGSEVAADDVTAGFTSPGDAGAYTNGSLASLQFTAPPAPEDMTLLVKGSAFLVGTRLPQQKIGVAVNGRPAGELVWRDGSVLRRELTIPKHLLPGGKTVVEFHLPNAASPAELGVGSEKRKLGVCVSNVALYPVSGFAPDAQPLQYHYGDMLSFVAGKNPLGSEVISGFTAPGDQGAYTDGSLSSLVMSAPKATEDMVLQVNANPFLVGNRLPQQAVGVSVNGHAVGEWIWKEGTFSRQKLIIPKADLPGGKTTVQLHLRNATSPEELGQGGESRKLGILVSNVVMYPASQFAPDEHPLQYHYGDMLSFVAGKNPLGNEVISGFTAPGEQGAYTDGSVASLVLAAPKATEDMKLQVNANPFLAGARLPQQSVGVSINGRLAGEWVWKAETPSRQELVIPKDDLPGGKTVVEFHLRDATSPQELGQGGESRKFGILVSNVAIYPASGFAPDEHPLQYQYGDKLSFVEGANPVGGTTISGFTPPGDRGSYTDGSLASVRFAAPPAGEDMKLEVDATAFLAGDKLPKQEVLVSVNGHAAGELTWKDGDPARHKLLIPKTFLPGGKTVLEFHIPYAASPAELGLYAEGRKLGICVASISFYPASDTSSDEVHLNYRWGDVISFLAGKNPLIGGAATKDFTAPGEDGAYTDGPLASVRFAAPPAGEDMKLQINAAPFLGGDRLPEQSVSVSVNHQAVGEWTWKEGGNSQRELIVPKDLLAGTRMLVEFHVAHPTSPAELGLYAEDRKFGIRISSLAMYPADDAGPGEEHLAYKWGEKLSFVAGKDSVVGGTVTKGFTEPGNDGAYTNGPLASVYVAASPAAGDMKLEVFAGAFVIPDRLPEQRVKILVNHHPVGEWTWNNGAASLHELTIPKEYLGGTRVLLEFQIAHPASPAELRLYAEDRKLGMRVSSIVLRPTGK